MKDAEALRIQHHQEAIISLNKGEEKVALEPGQIWSSLRGAIRVGHHSDQERHSYSGGRAENKPDTSLLPPSHWKGPIFERRAGMGRKLSRFRGQAEELKPAQSIYELQELCNPAIVQMFLENGFFGQFIEGKIP